MAEMFDSSEPDNKMRVGQVTTLAVGLEAESGNELVATRHRGSPLSDDVGRLCAAPLSGDNARYQEITPVLCHQVFQDSRAFFWRPRLPLPAV